MPDVGRYKDKKNWMADCMHQTLKVEGKKQDQAVAICLNMWRNRNKKKKGRVKKTAGGILRSVADSILSDKSSVEKSGG